MAKRRGSKKRRPRHGSNAPISQSTFSQVWSEWDAMHGSGKANASPFDAIKQSVWVYAAITFIADAVARTPFRAVASDGVTFLPSTPLQRFIDRPNNYGNQNTSAKHRYAYMFELLLHGSAMRLLDQFAGFKPGIMAVFARHFYSAKWSYDDLGREVVDRWISRRPAGRQTFMPGDDIYHDALYSPLHDFEGLSPLAAAMVAIANDIDLDAYAAHYFANDGATGIVFTSDHPDFRQAQATAAAEAWRKLESGRDAAFKAKFLGFGLKPNNVGSTLDSRLLKTFKELTKEQILSGIYKLPSSTFSSEGSSGGDIVIGGASGGEQASARETALVDVIMPWAVRYDEVFNADISWRFGPGVRAVHDFSDNPILEKRRLERAQIAAELLDRGFTLNATIRWLRLEIEEFEHGDDWWVENTRLPARLILDAGDEAKRIAIPDRVTPTPSDPIKGKRQEVHEAYIASIVDLASRVAVLEAARDNPETRRASAGQSNADRIDDLLAGGRLGIQPNGVPR